MSEEDPGFHDVLGVQCDAPPERQIPTTHAQENLAHPENNPETTDQVEEMTKDDLEGPENLAAAFDRNPGEGPGNGDRKSTTESTSYESKQPSREEKKPEKDVRSEESPAASGEEAKAGEPFFLVAEGTSNKVAAPSPHCSTLSVPDVTENVELLAASNPPGTPPENACQTEIVSEGKGSEDASIGTKDNEDAQNEEVERLWEDAILSQSVDELLRILREKPSLLLKLEEKGKKRGRTALHIAAKSDHADNLELAKLILEQLLQSRQEKYTTWIFTGESGHFHTVDDYIRAVEKNSKKTATELAKEKNEQVFDYIKYIQKCSAAHATIDRDVNEISRLDWYSFDADKFKTGDRAERERTKTWLGQAIATWDCTLLMGFLDDLPSQPTRDLWEDDLWTCKDWSGRTMLHVAAMQGCFPFARRLLDHARARKDHTYVEAVDDLSGLTALQMANDVIGNRSIAEYVTNTLGLIKNEKYEHPCFFEVYPRRDWCLEEWTGDDFRINLMRNHRLLLETYKGMTVLHVAILRKDHELVKALLDLFGEEKKISFGESHFPSQLTWQQMLHKEAKLDESVFKESRLRIVEKGRLSFTSPFKVSAMDLVHLVYSNNGDNDGDTEAEKLALLLENYDKASIGNSVPPEGSSQVKSTIENMCWAKVGDSVLPERSFEVKSAIESMWKAEWDRGYKADVDFNFEAEPRLTFLKVHYACKHPLKFKEFLKSFSYRDFCAYYPLQDAQGRTVYHISLDYSDNEDRYPGRWVFHEVFEDPYESYEYVQDARGRYVFDIFLMKNYLQYNILLENREVFQYDFTSTSYSSDLDSGYKDDNKFDLFKYGRCYNPTNINDYVVCMMFYHVATILKQTNVAYQAWSILEDNPISLKFGLFEFKETVPFIAASTGNQVLLQILLEYLDDINIIDARGRTLLHHAANSTLLEFDELLKCPMILHCFSTVKDLCEVKKKWNIERKKASMTIPLQKPKKDSDMENFITRMYVERKACILLLLQAGVDLSQEDKKGKVPNIGPTNDANFQSWWYETVVKDCIDKKNNFNQAASALSVVGTLVAATSYVGPLQPPVSDTESGEVLIKMFMVTNTLAFYLAMTSVIFAVVPSLPMPQESALLELKRAQHIVTLSLYILLMSIISIILSFGAASMVVMQDQHSYPGSDSLFFPSIIGCFFCFIAIVSFLVRVMRLTFYGSGTIKRMYKWSFTKFCKKVLEVSNLASTSLQ